LVSTTTWFEEAGKDEERIFRSRRRRREFL
jgi:hypothetical protein